MSSTLTRIMCDYARPVVPLGHFDTVKPITSTEMEGDNEDHSEMMEPDVDGEGTKKVENGKAIEPKSLRPRDQIKPPKRFSN